MDKTKSQIMDTTLPKLYQKLRLYRFNSAEWGPNNMKAETYSFSNDIYHGGVVNWVKMGQNHNFLKKVVLKQLF